MTTSDAASRPARTRACPVCGRPVLPAARPFCSDRCRQVDLGRWLNGDYAIAGDPHQADEAMDSPGGFR